MNKQFILLFFATFFTTSNFCGQATMTWKKFIQLYKNHQRNENDKIYLITSTNHGNLHENFKENLTVERDENGEFWTIRKESTNESENQ